MSHVRLSEITPECLRLEFSRGGRFVDGASVVARTRRASRVVVSSRIGEVVELATAGVTLRVVNDGRAFHPGNTRARIGSGGGPVVTWNAGDEPRRNLGGTLSSLDGVRGPVDIGHGVLTRDGWFVLDDSHTPVVVDGWPAARESVTGDDPDRRDWYLFAYGGDYRAALRALAAVTGPVALPRRALLGSWYSRFWPYSSEEFKAIVGEYRERGFGLDVLVLDMDWHTRRGWTGWSWNRSLIPDPPALIRWLHEQGLLVTLNLHPADGVGPHEDRYADLMRALGRKGGAGETAKFDPGDRRYMTALRGTVLAPLHDDGVDFWWLDWQQHHMTPSLASLTNLRQLNDTLGADSMTTPTPAVRVKGGAALRPALLSRWAGWGDQANPVHFSGDAHAGWPSLAFQVDFTARAGNTLACFWSHDIGGHFGRRDEECVARWVQFGAVSAALRLHSAHAAALDRRPWTCAPMFAESMRRAFRVRSRLMPTIYGAAQRCGSESLPLVRPMYLDQPGDERAYSATGQYMLGDLLVAPVTTPGVGERRVATRRVWLPGQIARRTPDGATGEGPHVQAWCHWFTGERFKADAESLVSSDIDEFPLFAPAGVPILLADPDHPMGSSTLATLTIRVYPMEASRTSNTVLYEDDGVSTAYLDGRCALTDVIVSTGPTQLGLVIEPTRGAVAGQVAERRYVIELPLLERGGRAEVDGVEAPIEFVPAGPDSPPMAKISIPPRPIGQRTTLAIQLPHGAVATANDDSRLRRLRGALAAGVPETDLRHALERLARSGDANLAAALSIAAGIGVQTDDHGDACIIDSNGLADDGRVRVTLIDELAGARKPMGELMLTVPPGTSVTITEPRALADPAPGLRASRLARVEFSASGRPVAFETCLRTILAPIRRWRIAGPFPFDDGRPIAEQRQGPELGATVRWRAIGDVGVAASANACPSPPQTCGGGPSTPPYAVDLNRHIGPGDRLVYAVTALKAPRALDATLHLEAADRLEAWVNGEKVFSDDPGETMDSASGSARIRLLAGANEVRLKLTRGGAGFGFTAAIDAGEALTELG